MAEKQQREYVIIYKSLEHFEVLGFVKADSLEEAKKKAQKDLLAEARHYNVTTAEIGELKEMDKIYFKISS